MWLFIESIQSDFFQLGLIGSRRTKLSKITRRSNHLLATLSRIISRRDLQRIEGICVVEGPGAFTPVRTGVLIANILARIYKKPLVGITVDQALDLSKLVSSLMDNNYCPTEYVAPKYSSEPNITIKKIST